MASLPSPLFAQDLQLALSLVLLSLHARGRVSHRDTSNRIETLVREAWPTLPGIPSAPSAREVQHLAPPLLARLTESSSPEELAYLPCQLFQSLVVAADRKRLGEFYTPRWLVELALQRIGWPDKSSSLVDPTCGSGAFLAGAALALRNQPNAPSIIAKRISGADINPLAVLGARVACLCAIADLLEPDEPFEPDIQVADLLDERPPRPSDLVVGNPPWIRFSELDQNTQKRVAEVAQHYDLVPARSFHGG